jgi:hypothetical protein
MIAAVARLRADGAAGPKETAPDAAPATQALDAQFTDAVRTVRRIGP